MNSNTLITGAGNRIGAAIATVLAGAGHRVVIHYHHSSEDAENLVDAIQTDGGQAACLQADLTNHAERQNLIEAAAKTFGPLSNLINNASVFEPDSALTINEDLWDRHFALHSKAPIFMARDFARQLPEGTKGNIINIVDECVLHTNPAYFSYNLSKSVLWTATKTLAQSLAPSIRVNAIGPGPTLPNNRQTGAQFQNSIKALPLHISASPQDIAEAAMFLLKTPSMTGQLLALDGGEHLEWRGRSKLTPAPNE